MGFILLMTVLALALIGAVTTVVYQYMHNRQRLGAPLNKAERKELESARVVIDRVKELAYEYRDLDSNLSYRLLDTIKDHERKELR